VLAAGTAAQATFSALLIGLPALAPALRSQLGLSLHEVGAILAATSVGLVLTLLPWGLAADRVGERIVVTAGLLGAALALAAAAAVSSGPALFVLLAVAGAAGGAVNSGSGRAVMRWFPSGERGLALGIRQTAIPIGGAVAALALPAIAEAANVHWSFLALALACLGGAVIGAVFLRDPGGERVLEVADPRTFADRRLWLLCAGSSLILVAQIAIIGFVVLFLNESRDVSTAAAAAVLAAIQVGGAALRIGTGIWSDRIGDRLGPLQLVGIGSAVTLAVATAVANAPLWLTVPAFLLAGSLSMGWNSLSFAAAAELGGGRRSGAAIGVQQTALALAGASVPVLFAAGVAAASWQSAYVVAAACPVAGAVVLRWSR